jgi:23S rRNA pseudouridine2605 synthase
MEERLQKILSERGVCSRRQAEQMIQAGRVTVNGMPATLGQRADAARDQIMVDGVALGASPERRYLLLHKPRGYVTTLHDERGRKSVAELVRDCGARVYPVGRLDLDSEGLLLMTNDGELANRMMHPSGEVDKVYQVTVDGFDNGAVSRLGQVRQVDGLPIRPAQVAVLSAAGTRAVLQVTIHEGRNRQVRKMCAQAGLQVCRLVRVAEGTLQLGDLPPGAWRELTPAERAEVEKLLQQEK